MVSSAKIWHKNWNGLNYFFFFNIGCKKLCKLSYCYMCLYQYFGMEVWKSDDVISTYEHCYRPVIE